MKNIIDECNLIYHALGDDISRIIYKARILFSLTGEEEQIRKIMNTVPIIQKFEKIMDSTDKKCSRLIYGAGMRGRTIVRYWKYAWDAFIDQNELLWGKTQDNLPIMSLADALKSYEDPIIVVTNRVGFDEIEKNLMAQGIPKDKIINMGKLWADLTDLQYFDLKYLPKEKKEVFVDLGVYDGYSSKMFVDWYGGEDYKIWGFEPDKTNLKDCEVNMRKYFPQEKYTLINKATWSEAGKMSFSNRGFVDSALSPDGEGMVSVAKLDDELKNEEVTFIKMDIEGAEFETLQGAENIIKKSHPKLAISIYHKKDDIFTIPSLIYRFNNQYTFYLRHYSFFDWDTVLYAIPQKK